MSSRSRLDRNLLVNYIIIVESDGPDQLSKEPAQQGYPRIPCKKLIRKNSLTILIVNQCPPRRY